MSDRDPFTPPFAPDDEARRAIWEMLVPRDIDAFLAADWSMVEDDFEDAAFFGIHGQNSPDADAWSLAFPDLASYRAEWLRQAKDFATQSFAEDPRPALFRATRLEEIEISGDRALVRKKFDGALKRTDGGSDRLLWQTHYHCHRIGGRWKICGFLGYLPNPLGQPAG
ncbi:hypothetical protein [Oceanomicrobium pacificus]|uniref:SnoaL-like domain-containing protein n=1 Tax=Oceanomicrobium pacificus TaxID=2692916 RepID=A0A6B0TZN5_9RHOB|nr:hypothetical protein [Oceanomicrobium pacificus]MXU66722.1 hypothetical protein [Oceanomicrobium pacificus]